MAKIPMVESTSAFLANPDAANKSRRSHLGREALARRILKDMAEQPGAALVHAEHYMQPLIRTIQDISKLSEEKFKTALTTRAISLPETGAKLSEKERYGLVHDTLDQLKSELFQQLKDTHRQCVKAAPGAALSHAPSHVPYLDQKERASLLIEAVEHAPDTALVCADLYMGFIPESSRALLLIEAAEKAPNEAVLFKDNYIHYVPEGEREPLLARAEEKLAALEHTDHPPVPKVTVRGSCERMEPQHGLTY